MQLPSPFSQTNVKQCELFAEFFSIYIYWESHFAELDFEKGAITMSNDTDREKGDSYNRNLESLCSQGRPSHDQVKKVYYQRYSIFLLKKPLILFLRSSTSSPKRPRR